MRYLPDLRPGEKLETFIHRFLHTPKYYRESMAVIIDSTVRYLHQFNGRVKKIVKSGSCGRGTMYGMTADIDLVIFFNGYKSMDDFLRNKDTIISSLASYICDVPSFPLWSGIDEVEIVRTNAYHIELRLKKRIRGKIVTIGMDILPTMDIIAMHGGDIKSVLREMITKSKYVMSHYSVCFCEEQRNLYDGSMAKVKDLIRLVKYWRTANGLKMKSYSCENVVLWVFEHCLEKATSFDMVTGFKYVMSVLSAYDQDELELPIIELQSLVHPKRRLVDKVNGFSVTDQWDKRAVQKCAKDTLAALEKEERLRSRFNNWYHNTEKVNNSYHNTEKVNNSYHNTEKVNNSDDNTPNCNRFLNSVYAMLYEFSIFIFQFIVPLLILLCLYYIIYLYKSGKITF